MMVDWIGRSDRALCMALLPASASGGLRMDHPFGGNSIPRTADYDGAAEAATATPVARK